MKKRIDEEPLRLQWFVEVIGGYRGLVRRDGEAYLVISAKKEMLVPVEQDGLDEVRRQLAGIERDRRIAVMRVGEVSPGLCVRLLPRDTKESQ
jgi:hypothetical protein